MKKLKKRDTMLEVFNLTTVNQDEVASGSPVTDYAAANGYDIQDANEDDFYPTMYRSGTTISSLEFSADGTVASELIAGAHPPRRPK